MGGWSIYKQIICSRKMARESHTANCNLRASEKGENFHYIVKFIKRTNLFTHLLIFGCGLSSGNGVTKDTKADISPITKSVEKSAIVIKVAYINARIELFLLISSGKRTKKFSTWWKRKNS
jgi:hypothetical protein